MPLVLVELLSGRSDQQLREFTRVVTEAVVDILDATADSVVVRFCEYPASRMGSGGVLAVDKHASEHAGEPSIGAPDPTRAESGAPRQQAASEH